MASMHYDAAGYPMFPGGSELSTLFGPDDLTRLQQLFDGCLMECRLDRESQRARALGKALVRLYAQGQRDPTLIRTLLVPSFRRQG